MTVGYEMRKAIVASAVIAGAGLLSAGCGLVGQASEAPNSTAAATTPADPTASTVRSNDPTTTAAPAGGAAAGTACSLVSSTDVEKVIGGPLRPPKDSATALATMCTYNSPNKIFEVTAAGPAQIDAFLRRHKTTAIPGLGDRAAESTDDPDDYIIGAVRGPHYVQFNIFHTKPDQAAVKAVMVKALAAAG